MMPRPFPSPAERTAFRHHIEKYMQQNGYRATALYLLLYLSESPTSYRGMAETCHRMNISQLNALSIFEPFCFFDDRAHVFLSCAIPENLQCFSMSCEIAELLCVEPNCTVGKQGYWHQEMIQEDAPSRAFALELCLPSPKMFFFKKYAYTEDDIAEYAHLDISIVKERLSMSDYTINDIKKIISDYISITGQHVVIQSDSLLWVKKQ